MVQVGREPADSKPIPVVGQGAREIRVRDEARAFRVIWVASFGEAVYVLHAFQKKTPRTSRHDVELAARRYRQVCALARAE
jgi:phage-related protein